MKIIAELHTHTNEYCTHAHSSIDDFARVAIERGYKYLAVTNHSPLADRRAPASFYVDTIDKKISGIKFLPGIEEDVRDVNGGLNLAQCDLLRMSFVIASLHFHFDVPIPDYTAPMLAAIKNPAVDCIGHIARDPDFIYDIDTLLNAAKEYGKLIEFNSWSLIRFDRYEACGHVMDKCAELGIGCVVTGDAHATDRFGDYDCVIKMLKERNFPEELVINASEERMEEFLARRKEEKKEAYMALFKI